MAKEQQFESAPPELLTVKQFCTRYPAWSESGIRALILNAEDRLNSRGDRVAGNGLAECGAVLRVGRKVLLNVPAFFGPWLAAQQQRQRKAA